MRRPLATICVNVRPAIYDSVQSVDMDVDLARLDVGALLHNHVGGLVPGLTGRLVPCHHAVESRAVLGVVHALRATLASFDRAFRAAFGHGQRLRAAHELGNYVMAGNNENVCSEMPTCRHTSPTGTPDDTCCNTDVICSTENRFFFTAHPPGRLAGLCRTTRSHIEPKYREPLS